MRPEYMVPFTIFSKIKINMVPFARIVFFHSKKDGDVFFIFLSAKKRMAMLRLCKDPIIPLVFFEVKSSELKSGHTTYEVFINLDHLFEFGHI